MPLPLTIIIPQHTRADLTLACVASIRRYESPPWPILVIDDGSPDDSAEQIAHAITRNDTALTLLRAPRLGLTSAWNAAARATETPYLLFLNNDVVASGPFVERLVEPLERRAVGMTGVRMRRESALPQRVLASLPAREFLEGWCLTVRRDDFLALDGFDESMRLYWSDTDLQCRLMRSTRDDAFGLRAIPDLPLRHLAHQTTHASPAHRAQWHTDRATFIKKWTSFSPRPTALRGERGRG